MFGTKIKVTGFLVEQSKSHRPTAHLSPDGVITIPLEEVVEVVEVEVDRIPIPRIFPRKASLSRKVSLVENSQAGYLNKLKPGQLDSGR